MQPSLSRCRSEQGLARVIRKDDVVTSDNCIIKIMTNKKRVWQQRPAPNINTLGMETCSVMIEWCAMTTNRRRWIDDKGLVGCRTVYRGRDKKKLVCVLRWRCLFSAQSVILITMCECVIV